MESMKFILSELFVRSRKRKYFHEVVGCEEACMLAGLSDEMRIVNGKSNRGCGLVFELRQVPFRLKWPCSKKLAMNKASMNNACININNIFDRNSILCSLDSVVFQVLNLTQIEQCRIFISITRGNQLCSMERIFTT